MKLQRSVIAIVFLLTIFAIPCRAFGQIQTIEFTQDELDEFQAQGYVVRSHLPYEVYNRLVFGRIQPLHAEFGNEVTFESHNDVNGRFSVYVSQEGPIQSIDAQRILDVDCCLSLYKDQLQTKNLEFGNSYKKIFRLPELEKNKDDETVENGTFNGTIDILVFPDF